MYNEEQISKEQLIKELEEIEKDEIFLDEKDDLSSETNVDIVKLYLKEMAKYPLLTLEEEKKLGSKLKLINNITIVDKKINNNDTTYSLNIPLIFSSLIDNPSHSIIIDSLIAYYEKNQKPADEYILEILRKYSIMSSNLGRTLNKQELKEHFDIESNSINTISEKELLTQTKEYLEYKNAFDKIFNSNLRLVVSIAKKYKGKFEMLDIISEGNIGLLKAIERFDSSLGYKFSTYATWWIKQAVQRYAIHQIYPTKMPEYFINSLQKFKKTVDKLQQEKQETLSAKQIAKELSIPMETVLEYLKFSSDPISMDQKLSQESDFTIGDTVESDEDLENSVLQDTISDNMENLLECLSEKEKQVIMLRYGFGEKNRKASLQEVGEVFGISRERTRQIESKALLKMRKLVMYNKKYAGLKEYFK